MKTSAFFSRLTGLGIGLLGVALAGCTDPYLPSAIQNPPRLLVVDGFINSKGATTLLLSRASNLAAPAAPPAETKARVYVEELGGPSVQLTESPAGTYTSAARTLNPAKKYRLHLTTAAGQEFATDYQPVVTTPPFDRFGWRAEPDGLKIFLAAHDAANATHFYRWQYEETWESIPIIVPTLEWEVLYGPSEGRLIPIRNRFPLICWGNEKSSDIKLVNTTRLAQDVVADYVVRALPTTSYRLRHRYSILVTQAAQSEDEFHYWELLKKNTENIGTLFDPQPVQLTGNVRCLSDPAALALGFVGVHSVEQRRLFVERSQLPFDWNISSEYDKCPTDVVKTILIPQVFGSPDNIPIIYAPDGVLATSRECVDCRLHGSVVKPPFWP
ncbi:DUF4249 domain-containing protein [Hymenobacter sp. DH14]|uniref:DUF4249 domain-containing protein n=1 Tax=Hymenobacter cyanobacteriorum TaxID=2926463 RepID=A0A9X1VG41_9BACT|nr:DUF4249 domain-containing protein [Hymenobacter cyanobacteriorum]MCI1188564.1 DUF4249 domain-containing protein [Hymenobacter cyanobacteriorum]